MSKQVKVTQGILEGEETLSYAVYKGIPYAKPPVGDLRFRRPQPPEAWEGIRQARTFGPKAWQGDQSRGFYGKEFYQNQDFMPEMSEDCLYLNVWTPIKPSKEEKGYPVAFWIHGGAFLGGFGSEMEFDGAEYAKRGVILVTFNYRLGALGFLATPELAAEDEDATTGNYGFLDQVAALQWVRDNIAAFGGDPDRITVFGQSAGGISVGAFCCSPLTQGMFSAAIIQSGNGREMMSDLHREQAYENSRIYLKACHIKNVRELREADPAFLVKKQFNMRLRLKAMLPFRPMCDDYALSGGYLDNLDAGSKPVADDVQSTMLATSLGVANVPYLIGSNRNDIFVKRGKTGNQGGSVYEGCIDWATKRNEADGKPVYVYYFDQKMPGDKAGAFHSAELWYMFGTLARCWRPVEEWDYEISTQMLDGWCNFMKYHDPNGHRDEVWKPYTEEDPFIFQIG